MDIQMINYRIGGATGEMYLNHRAVALPIPVSWKFSTRSSGRKVLRPCVFRGIPE